MIVCRPGTAVKSHAEGQELHGLKCKTWRCRTCVELRRRQLVAQAIGGEPDSFITFTLSATLHPNPELAARVMIDAFGALARLIRRTWRGKPFEYLWITEATKIGTPHLHVLARAPYIPQRWLSAEWERLTGSRIVDIRRIRGRRQVAAYAAKYAGKNPHQFGTCKRYSATRGYRVAAKWRKPPLRPGELWFIDHHRSPAQLAGHWRDEGWRVVELEPGRWNCFRPPPAQGAH